MSAIEINQVENDIRSKRLIMWISIAIIILFIISIVLFAAIHKLKQQQLKFKINNVSKKASSNLFHYENDDVYVSLKKIAPLINYDYFQGGYKEYSEDEDKCYLQSQNEICTFESDSDVIYKTPTKTTDYEYFNLTEKIRMIDDELYIKGEDLGVACNLVFSYKKSNNSITINTLDNIVSTYTKNYKDYAVTSSFKNQKALLYNLIVTQSVDNTIKNNHENIYYGISTLENQKVKGKTVAVEKELVGKKYTNIEFVESTQEFIVKTTENKVGIITSEGETKVAPTYDSLKQIDKNLNLYLATRNNKQGIIEKNGKTLIYLEYDKIGINANNFQGNNIKNPYILFDNAIPVMQNGKWGLYDIKGNCILNLEYDGIGCSANSVSNNVVIIPSIKAIVVSKNYQIKNRGKITLYGFVNYLGKQLVDAGLEKVYTTVTSGRVEYKMDYNGQTYNVIEKIKEVVPNLDELNDATKTRK